MSSPMQIEAKKVAALYARWLRLPEDALFHGGRGPVMKMYEALKNAKNKEDIKAILDLSKYEMERQTYNDLTRLVNEIFNRIQNMSDQDAVTFTLEVFRYFQIALATKIEDVRKGYWA